MLFDRPVLLEELSGDPYDEACAYYRKDDAGDPAAAYSEKVPDEPADESADDTGDDVPEYAALVALHYSVGDKPADTAYYDLDD